MRSRLLQPGRSYVLPLFAGTIDICNTAPAQLRMLHIAPYVRTPIPAADALRVTRRLHCKPYSGAPGVSREDGGVRRTRNLMHTRLRRDEQEAQLLAQGVKSRVLIGRAVDIDLGIERRADRC